jgi:Tfp pilus assembly protein FimT
MKAVCVVAFVAAVVLARAAAIAQPSSPAPANPPAAAPSMQNFGEKEKTCSAWTDDCRSCRREADNAVNCSNIGIACQPAEIKCTARQEPAK